MELMSKCDYCREKVRENVGMMTMTYCLHITGHKRTKQSKVTLEWMRNLNKTLTRIAEKSFTGKNIRIFSRSHETSNTNVKFNEMIS